MQTLDRNLSPLPTKAQSLPANAQSLPMNAQSLQANAQSLPTNVQSTTANARHPFVHTSILLCLLLFGPAAWTNANAQLTLVTYYHFNDSNLVSDRGAQPSTITSDFVDTNITFANGGTTVNAVSGDPAGQSLTLQNGTSGINNGRSIQFGVSTIDFASIMLSYATQRSSTGFTTQALSYSTNGADFTNFGSNTSIPTSFGLASFDLSSVAAVENQASVTFRLTFTGGSTTSATGNNRLDNIQLNATAVPEASATLVAAALFGFGCFRRGRRRQTVSA